MLSDRKTNKQAHLDSAIEDLKITISDKRNSTSYSSTLLAARVWFYSSFSTL